MSLQLVRGIKPMFQPFPLSTWLISGELRSCWLCLQFFWKKTTEEKSPRYRRSHQCIKHKIIRLYHRYRNLFLNYRVYNNFNEYILLLRQLIVPRFRNTRHSLRMVSILPDEAHSVCQNSLPLLWASSHLIGVSQGPALFVLYTASLSTVIEKHCHLPLISWWCSTPEISKNPRSLPVHAEVYWWR